MQTITGGGVFTRQNINDINDNFAELQTVDVWVRPQYGNNNTADGSWDKPYATMAGVSKLLKPGLVIGLDGVLLEEFAAPVGVNNVTIIGNQVTPRQATTSGIANGGGATWLSPSGGTGSLVTLRAQGWSFINVYFNCSATAGACVKLSRSGTGDPPTDPDGSHAAFVNCRFTGANYGIEDAGGCGFVQIDQCEFFNFSGTGDTAIKNSSTAIAAPLRWVITNTTFWGNANHIVSPASRWTIKGCVFQAATTVNINFTGGVAPNFVQQNAFGIAAADFDPAGGVTGVTGDAWSNYLTDAIETGLPAN
ncbi:MAG TPA: hypothetical protein VF573_27335 [Paraburkholderia sp.]|uniref:hypothetical protein n=1 Tax=Paraburkholderia sp. TaxID=1926495 RepID=UPI002ED5C41D